MKKIMRYAALGFLGILAASSWAWAEPIVQVSEQKAQYRDKADGTVYLTTSFCKAAVENADKYPSLSAAVKSGYNEIRENYVKQRVEDNGPGCQEMVKRRVKDNTAYAGELQEKLTVCRADDIIVSLQCRGFEFYGGAHPMSFALGYNFDASTGRELKLSDAVKDRRAFSDAAVAVLRSEFAAREADFTDEIKNQLEEYLKLDADGKQPVAWTMDGEGVTLYFGAYTFGPYALGAFDLKIKFDDGRQMFVDKYVPERKCNCFKRSSE